MFYPVKGNQATLLKDIELAFEGLDKDLANDKLRWNNEVKKAQEHRDRERLEKLVKKGPKTGNSTQWPLARRKP